MYEFRNGIRKKYGWTDDQIFLLATIKLVSAHPSISNMPQEKKRSGPTLTQEPAKLSKTSLDDIRVVVDATDTVAYDITPSFDELFISNPEMFSKNGKIVSRVTLPLTPLIYCGGVLINPSSTRRTAVQTEAFRKWKDAAQLWNVAKSYKPDTRIREDHNSKESREKYNQQRRADRREAGHLIWWIVYGCTRQKSARFNGDRNIARADTFRAMALAEAWYKHAKQSHVSVDIYTGFEDKSENYDVDVEECEDGVVISGPTITDAARAAATEQLMQDENYDMLPVDRQLAAIEDLAKVIMRECPGASEYKYTDAFDEWWKLNSETYKDYDYAEHYYRKTHWDVTCLESANDMNIFLKWKVLMPKKIVVQAIMHLGIGKIDGDTVGYNPQVSRMDDSWSVLRYLAFGYCADGHKTYEGVDKTPVFGLGELDMKQKHLRSFISYSIEKAGHRLLNDMKCPIINEHGLGKYPTWFTRIRERVYVTEQMFNDVKRVCLAPMSCGDPSTAERRINKLLQYSDVPRERVHTLTLKTLFCILGWHSINACWFKASVLAHLGHNSGKEQLAFVGESSCGKSCLSRPLVGDNDMHYEGLLKCSMLPTAAGLTRWSKFRGSKDTDCLMSPELQKAFKDETLNESEFISLCDDPVGFEPAHCEWPIVSNIPMLINAQSMNFGKDKVTDYGSLKNRLKVVRLDGGELPVITSPIDPTCLHPWFISKEAMSVFLGMSDEEIVSYDPTYKKMYLFQHKLFKVRKSRLSEGADPCDTYKTCRRKSIDKFTELYPELFAAGEVTNVEDNPLLFDDCGEDEDFGFAPIPPSYGL